MCSVTRDILERKGPQGGPQKRLDRRLEGVAEAVGGGYYRLQIPLKLAFVVRETVAGHRLGALEEGGETGLPMQPCPSPSDQARAGLRLQADARPHRIPLLRSAAPCI